MFAGSSPGRFSNMKRYGNIVLNKRTRDFWGDDECCRRSRDQMYCKCPTDLEGIHPIVDGSFIWYKLDPENGFMNSDDMTRFIRNSGNTQGNHGHMYSGVSLVLGTDGYIDVRVDSPLDSVTYFDGNQRKFVQVVNENNDRYIRLQDSTFGSIIKLTKRKFTENDLIIFSNDPEEVIRWRFNEPLNISLKYSSLDSVYAVIEGEDFMLYEVDFLINRDTLSIIGNYAWNKNVDYGLQLMRMEEDTFPIPYEAIENNGEDIVNNGEQVIDII